MNKFEHNGHMFTTSPVQRLIDTQLKTLPSRNFVPSGNNKEYVFSCAEAVGVSGGSEVQVRLDPGDFSDGLDS